MEKEKKDLTGREISNKNLLKGKAKRGKIPEDLEDYISPLIPAQLDPNELEFYVKEIRNWIDGHPDWNAKEDIDDINGIAMEKIVQHRLMSRDKKSKDSYISDDYSKSKYREQVHRGNLGARRSDRIKEGKNSVSNTNIIFLSGEIDRTSANKITMLNKEDKEEEDSLFKDTDIFDIEAEEVNA